jgi:hypothetical protein
MLMSFSIIYKGEIVMSFQDLLKQPLPSQMENDYVMEAANPAKIAADVMDLNKTYKASTKAINDDIKSIRITVKRKRFNEALNIINTCRKDVISDRNEIGKMIKSIESNGLNKNTIRAVMLGTTVVAGTKLAIDSSVRSKLKSKKDDLYDKYANSGSEYAKAYVKSLSYDTSIEEEQNQIKNYIDRDINSHTSDLEKAIKERDKYREKVNQYEPDDPGKELCMKFLQDAESRCELINERIKKAKNDKKVAINNIGKLQTKRRKAMDECKSAKNANDAADKEFKKAKADVSKHNMKAATSNTVLAAGGGVTYATIKLFMLIKNNYEKYYDGVQKTLDELEDKCEKQSQNIKECLIDFVITSQDMEILLESAEEIDYIDEE